MVCSDFIDNSESSLTDFRSEQTFLASQFLERKTLKMLENKKVFSEFQTALVKVKQSEENLEKILSERLKSQCFVLFSDFSDNSESFEFSIGENFEVFFSRKTF